MQGVAPDIRTRHCRVDEAQVEERIVTHQDSALAAAGADGVADLTKDPLQRIFLGDRRPQRMMMTVSMPTAFMVANSLSQSLADQFWLGMS